MKLNRAIKSLVPALLIAATGHSQAQANLNEFVFSLDIGSDTEISDPAGGVAELADPGDVYRRSNVAGSLGGAPYLDDFGLFGGADPAPQQGVAASAVPVGDPTALYTSYFDLDGYDSIDIPLTQLDLSPNAPLATPIWRVNGLLSCVERARNLSISYNDDDVTGWRAPNPARVATEGPSPLGNVYGSTAGRNEVLALEISLAGGYPATVVALLPAASESEVHADLAPNPAFGEGDDDDVDALDRTDSDVCQVHLFSADGEARLNLHPGTIYQRVAGAAPVGIIGPVHLGTAMSADIDAFEFVWLPHPANQQEALAIIYSVDPDDPATAPDESGGLVPSTIYASFLTGSSFELVVGPANGLDDIDAITTAGGDGVDSDDDGVVDANDNCTQTANADQRDSNGDGYGNLCDFDLNGDCTAGIADLGIFRTVFFTSEPDADFDGDGTVGITDLARMRVGFFQPPGPSGLTDLCGP